MKFFFLLIFLLKDRDSDDDSDDDDDTYDEGEETALEGFTTPLDNEESAEYLDEYLVFQDSMQSINLFNY
jgi:importin-7